jgi:hypothetical protein
MLSPRTWFLQPPLRRLSADWRLLLLLRRLWSPQSLPTSLSPLLRLRLRLRLLFPLQRRPSWPLHC